MHKSKRKFNTAQFHSSSTQFGCCFQYWKKQNRLARTNKITV